MSHSQFFSQVLRNKEESSEESFEELDKLEKKTNHKKINSWIITIQKNETDINALDSDGETLLLFVAKHGNVEQMKWLIENGADVNLAAGDDSHVKGYTALHFATYHNNINVIKYLLESTNIIVDKSTKNGTTPLFLAIHNRNQPIINIFVKYGANFNASLTNFSGMSDTFLEIYLRGGLANSLRKDALESAEILLKLAAAITKKAIECVFINKNLDGLKLLEKYCVLDRLKLQQQFGDVFVQNLLDLADSNENNAFHCFEMAKIKKNDESEFRYRSELKNQTASYEKCREMNAIVKSYLERPTYSQFYRVI